MHVDGQGGEGIVDRAAVRIDLPFLEQHVRRVAPQARDIELGDQPFRRHIDADHEALAAPVEDGGVQARVGVVVWSPAVGRPRVR